MSARELHGAGLRVLGAKIRKYRVAAAVALSERAAYRGSFLGSAFAYGLFVFVFSRIWTSVFADRSILEGYSRVQLIWYFIVAELPGVSFSGAFWTLSQDVKSGQVAYLVSKPYDFVLYSWAQGLGRAAANCAFLAIEGIVLGLILAGLPPLAAGSAFVAVLASLTGLGLALCVSFLLNLALSLTAFWVEENAAFYWIFQKLALIAGTLVPLEFLPAFAQRVAWWTPFPALAYVPAKLFAAWPGGGVALGLLASQLAWALGAFALCEAVYALARGRLAVNGG